MPIPLIPIITALAAGGTLVPHAAGGLIVTAATGGYVAGTYLSTTAIASLLTLSIATVGTGAAVITGAASTIIGSAGIFGTTIGATGLTGALMSAGLLPSTPIAVPALAGGAILVFLYTMYKILRLKWKLKGAKEEDEIQFTESEAKTIESIIKLIDKKKPIA